MSPNCFVSREIQELVVGWSELMHAWFVTRKKGTGREGGALSSWTLFPNTNHRARKKATMAGEKLVTFLWPIQLARTYRLLKCGTQNHPGVTLCRLGRAVLRLAITPRWDNAALPPILVTVVEGRKERTNLEWCIRMREYHFSLLT